MSIKALMPITGSPKSRPSTSLSGGNTTLHSITKHKINHTLSIDTQKISQGVKKTEILKHLKQYLERSNFREDLNFSLIKEHLRSCYPPHIILEMEVELLEVLKTHNEKCILPFAKHFVAAYSCYGTYVNDTLVKFFIKLLHINSLRELIDEETLPGVLNRTDVITDVLDEMFDQIKRMLYNAKLHFQNFLRKESYEIDIENHLRPYISCEITRENEKKPYKPLMTSLLEKYPQESDLRRKALEKYIEEAVDGMILSTNFNGTNIAETPFDELKEPIINALLPAIRRDFPGYFVFSNALRADVEEAMYHMAISYNDIDVEVEKALVRLDQKLEEDMEEDTWIKTKNTISKKAAQFLENQGTYPSIRMETSKDVTIGNLPKEDPDLSTFKSLMTPNLRPKPQSTPKEEEEKK